MQEAAIRFLRNVEIIMVLLFILNIIIIIYWLIFDNGWYTAYCSEFVKALKAKNLTFPTGWIRSEYKGCNLDNSSTTIAQSVDTLLYFGLDSFTAAKTADANTYYYIKFELGVQDAFFSQWEVLLWMLCALSLLGIICAITYWTIKTQNNSLMYTDRNVRNIFGPGAGFFSAICFIISMIAHMSYRQDVKTTPNLFKDITNLGYGSNFTVSTFTIILFGVISACSLSLMCPDEEALSKGRRTRASLQRAIRKSNIHGNGVFGPPPNNFRRNSKRASRMQAPQQRRSRAVGRNSVRKSVRRK